MLIGDSLVHLKTMATMMDDARLMMLCHGCCELNSRATVAMMSFRLGNIWDWDVGGALPGPAGTSLAALYDAFNRNLSKGSGEQ